MTRLLPLVLVSGVRGALELVVEREFGIGRNVSGSKEADANVTHNGPFLRFAVWLARVVHEATQTATGAGVNHAFTVQPEEVKRFVSGVLLFFETTLEFCVVNQFTGVLNDKIALLNFRL